MSRPTPHLEPNRGCVTVLIGALIVLALGGVAGTIYTVSVSRGQAVETLRRGLTDQVVRSDLPVDQKRDLQRTLVDLAQAYHDDTLPFTAVRECAREIDPLVKCGLIVCRLRLFTLDDDVTAEEEATRIDRLRRWWFLGSTGRVSDAEIQRFYDALVESKPAGIILRPPPEPDQIAKWFAQIGRTIERSGATFPDDIELDLAGRVRRIVRERLETRP